MREKSKSDVLACDRRAVAGGLHSQRNLDNNIEQYDSRTSQHHFHTDNDYGSIRTAQQ